MTDSYRTTATETGEATQSDDEQDITDGQYLYCLVDTDTTASMGSISTTGIDDAPVSVIEYGTVGAVVHDCATVYDSEDPDQVKQWLLAHQQVVDTASDVFGTPLPMRFDTILAGGNASVERWLRDHHERIREELTRFGDTWEYRIHLFWDPSACEDHAPERDAQLQELRKRQQGAKEGKRFLLEKKHEKRLRELKRERRTDLVATLERRVDPVVSELSELNDHSALEENEAARDREHLAGLAVLADEGNETVLGNALDEIVEQEGVEIRFTGPWPPYTFAPDIG